MTAEEAKKYMENPQIGLSKEGMITAIEVRRLCIEALEKQIPKEPKCESTPTFAGDYSIAFSCPVCGGFVGDEYDEEDKVYKFCYECGQAIDWGEGE